MISLQTHNQIRGRLEEWNALVTLHTTVQCPGHLAVHVMGSVRPEFYELAKAGALKVIDDKAKRIKAELQQLGFDIKTLPAMLVIPKVKATRTKQ